MTEYLMITTTDALAAFCDEAKAQPYVTIDTEFLRERTFYSRLCLIQMALPPASEAKSVGGTAVLVDPLASDLSLEPLYDLFRYQKTVKVFHAARQDLEIFFHDAGIFPTPLFDTQIAAMVCGFGEQAGYETLVRKIDKSTLDKSSRFTDWAQRPLSSAQLSYAIADVTHLRTIYEYLHNQLEESGRASWVTEETAVLVDPETYIIRPEDAWQRVRLRSSSPRFVAVVRKLAEFREQYAQSHNVPRSRVFKDDALVELASVKPQSDAELGKSRLLLREGRKPEIAQGILAAIKAGLDDPDPPRLPKTAQNPPGNSALSELLRVLLKAKAETAGVAPKLIASNADLEAFAQGDRDIAALQGWRAEVFGHDAMRLANGEIALSAAGGQVLVLDLP